MLLHIAYLNGGRRQVHRTEFGAERVSGATRYTVAFAVEGAILHLHRRTLN